MFIKANREAKPADWRTTVRSRLLVCAALLGLWTAAIEGRLLYLQVFEHADLAARAERQQNRAVSPPAKRGDILDRKGRLLAFSVDADTIAAVPSDIDDPGDVAAQLCGALDDCDKERRQGLTRKLTGRGAFAYVARQVSPEEARRVRALDLPGITLLKESRRYYPNSELAAHVVGYVGIDNVGLGGIESAYDAQIRGTAGKVLIQTDNKRRAVFSRVERPATAGAGIELTIDQYLQFVAERELRTGVEANHAAGGTAIVMDPHTGEILALANWPTFNPNAFSRVEDDTRRNRAIQTLYEPGSTFKIVTASAAIEEGVLKATDLIDCNPGVITFPGRKPITEAKGHNYGLIPFEDVIVKSSNIGAIKAGLRVGAERMIRFVHRFGFGELIGTDFTGQSRGIVYPLDQINDSTLASMSMGYNVSVTPLQMATAASAVANGGTLYAPHVVAAIVRDGKRDVVPPKVLRQAITQETASTVTTFMEGVVDRGTAKAAQMDRYQVAGKTGTAQQLVGGHYANQYNSSFVGFVPSRNPVFTILVVIDNPRQGGHYGGEVAAPVFKRIADAALRQVGVPATIRPIPPIVVTASDERVVPSQVLPTVIPVMTTVGDRKVMPDVRGLAARDAVRALGAIGLSVRLRGSGFVSAQTPEAGRLVDSGEVSVLDLRRTLSDAAKSSGGKEQ